MTPISGSQGIVVQYQPPAGFIVCRQSCEVNPLVGGGGLIYITFGSQIRSVLLRGVPVFDAILVR